MPRRPTFKPAGPKPKSSPALPKSDQDELRRICADPRFLSFITDLAAALKAIRTLKLSDALPGDVRPTVAEFQKRVRRLSQAVDAMPPNLFRALARSDPSLRHRKQADAITKLRLHLGRVDEIASNFLDAWPKQQTRSRDTYDLDQPGQLTVFEDVARILSEVLRRDPPAGFGIQRVADAVTCLQIILPLRRGKRIGYDRAEHYIKAARRKRS